jgi:hypothetical protein
MVWLMNFCLFGPVFVCSSLVCSRLTPVVCSRLGVTIGLRRWSSRAEWQWDEVTGANAPALHPCCVVGRECWLERVPQHGLCKRADAAARMKLNRWKRGLMPRRHYICAWVVLTPISMVGRRGVGFHIDYRPSMSHINDSHRRWGLIECGARGRRIKGCPTPCVNWSARSRRRA